MAIKSIPTAHKTNLTTGALGDRDDRFYIDFRQFEYPDLGTGSAQYTVAREDNLIDRGNCELGIAPMIFDETVPLLSDATFARSSTQAHTGTYSYKFTKTVAAGTAGIVYLTDNADAGDMHGMVAGAAYTKTVWIYNATGGIAGSEITLEIVDSAGSTTQAATSAVDAWQAVTVTRTLDAGATYARIRIVAHSDAADTENFYVDDVKMATHNVPGSHYLSSGYIENLLTMPDTFTVQLDFIPRFAYDTGSNQQLWGWYVSATQYLYILYAHASNTFRVGWLDGGTVRVLVSAQYDDGSVERNIGQRICLTAAIDLTTGDTTGSSLWLDKTQHDTTWSGNIDAKTTVFNKNQIRAYSGAAGAFDIAGVRFFSDLVATDAQVQADFSTVQNEEINFTLNGHGTGRTRCNISSYVLAKFDTERHKTDPINGSFSANKVYFSLDNTGGVFSDDQYAAYVPASNQYNGTTAQKYLRGRCGVIAESWYSGDFDSFFMGRISQGFPRASQLVNFSVVQIAAEDGVADLAKSFEKDGRYWEDHKLVNKNLIDRQDCRSSTPPAMYNETSVTASNALFARSTAQVYHGRYSYLFTVNGAADTWVDLQDALATDDMHILTAGETYKFRCKVWIDSGAITGTEVVLAIGDYHGAAWSEDTQAATNVYDSWQSVEVSSTLNAAATGVYVRLHALDAAVATETFHVAELELICTSKASEHEDVSLFHDIGKRGYRTVDQYLANPSFEEATIGNSWLVTAGGTLTRDVTSALFGSACAKLVPGAAAEQVYQTVTYTGTKKLNVGETYTFSIGVESAGAATGASNYIELDENDSSGNNDSTQQTYTLAGGEDYQIIEVSHTITDSDSDRLQVLISGDAADTIFMDGAALIQGDRALNFFKVNIRNGASGVEFADDASELTWPWYGFDVVNIDYLHGWRRMDRGSRTWDGMKSIGLASGARYCGFGESDSIKLRAYLEDGFSDPVIQGVFTGDDDVLRGMFTAPASLSANSIIGHGHKIDKSTLLQTLWMATASNSFTETANGINIAEVIADGARWPNTTTYPEYWARIGTYENRMPTTPALSDGSKLRQFVEDDAPLALYEAIMADQPYNQASGLTPETGGPASQIIGVTPIILAEPGSLTRFIDYSLDIRGWVEFEGNSRAVIGAQEVDIIHLASDSNGVQSGLTEVTEGTVVAGVDATSRAGEIRILLQNDTGSAVTLSECGLIGKPVNMFSDEMGYLHDTFIDTQDIEESGEKVFEFGNRDVIDQDQLNALADYYWKVCRGGKHTYGFAVSGLQHWISPGDRWLLQVGSAGNAEYVDSVIEISSVRCSYSRNQINTVIQATEVEENWKWDSNAFARYLASGNDKYLQSAGNRIFIDSEFIVSGANSRVPIGNTSAEDIINAAIDAVAGADGGGVVHLSKGKFKIDGDILGKANVRLEGEGRQTVIEKSHNGNNIDITGGYGTEISGFQIANLRLTRSDANTTAAIYGEYADDLLIENVTIGECYTGLYLTICYDTVIKNLHISNPAHWGIETFNGVFDCNITDLIIDGGGTAEAALEGGLVITGSHWTMTNVLIKGLSSTNTAALYGLSIMDPTHCLENIRIDAFDHSQAGQIVYGLNIGTTNCVVNNVSVTDIDNNATAANSYGIYIKDDDNELSGLFATGCSGTGIKIETTADATQIWSSRSTANTTANFTDSGTLSTYSVEDT